jgi:uncharacterized protein (DUF1015 family)
MRFKKREVMAQKIKPFKATHYNPDLLNDFSTIACPPYDIIDKDKIISLKKRSPYNYCRISLADGKNYDKPAQNLKKWLDQKILVDDCKENYYLYQQKFRVGQKQLSRYGILCLLNMEKKEIFFHEHTLDKPKEDRRKMIAKVKANLSPVFIVAGNAGNFLTTISKKYTKTKPFLEFKDDENNLNCLWKISKKSEIESISESLEESYMVIADGHHRFETSFDYFRSQKKKFKDLNYILAYIAVPQPGLVVLPTHRIISASGKNRENFERIKEDFILKPISQVKLGKKLKASRKFSFGVYWNNKFYFADLQNNNILDTISPAIYKKLDTYVFHQAVLPKLSYRKISYTHSIAQARKNTKKDEMAFLLKAVSLKSVFDIAKAGYKLPQKSTYFYPKLSSGLVLRRFRK